MKGGGSIGHRNARHRVDDINGNFTSSSDMGDSEGKEEKESKKKGPDEKA
jgi:hypothetical protein